MLIPHSNNFINLSSNSISPGGGIGRRKGLKIPRGQPRAGSTPALGIDYEKNYITAINTNSALWMLKELNTNACIINARKKHTESIS